MLTVRMANYTPSNYTNTNRRGDLLKQLPPRQYGTSVRYDNSEMLVRAILQHETHKFGRDREEDDRIIIDMLDRAKGDAHVYCDNRDVCVNSRDLNYTPSDHTNANRPRRTSPA